MTRRNKIIRQILLSISSGMLIAFIVASSFVLIRHTAIYPQIHLSINQLFSGNDLRPSPHYSFKMVVDIQMEALMNQNKANWQNFVRHNEAEVKIKNYQCGGSGDLVPVQNYSSYEIKKSFYHAGYVMQKVVVKTKTGSLVNLLFVLKLNEGSPNRNCWLTYHVYQLSVEQEATYI
jgi:hypothetical protein